MNELLKRLFDIVAAAVLALVLAPVMLLIAALVRLDCPGPVLFRQVRVGRRLRPFQIFKFRTMVVEAERNGPGITIGRDPRVTRVGRILRRFDLDELPSLLNVLRGDMSIVGPRPEVPEYLPYYTEEQRQVFSVRPGLTDLGTLAFRNEAAYLVSDDPQRVYVQEILPRKLALNLEYVKNRSFLLDLRLIFRTLIKILMQRKG